VVVCLFSSFISCVQNDGDRGRERSQQRAVTVKPPGLVESREKVGFPPDKYLTWINPDPGYLPKWKTEWERELERLSQVGGPGGSPLIDQYDTYRTTYASKFFITQPPATAGIRPPAEYEASQAYILNWTQYTQTAWKTFFGSIVKNAWGVVPVLMLYKDNTHLNYLVTQLSALGFSTAELQDPKNIIWYQQSTNSIWARDFGPVSIVSSGTPKLSFVDFRYYHARPYDDEIPADLAKDWGINDFRPDLEFEGGNFMSTSDGLCAATKGVLYYNPQYSQSAVEQIFKQYLGCKETVLTATMSGGVIAHIDMFAKFASDTAMLVGEYQATQDPTNKAILDANAALFAGKKTPSGKTMTVTRIPMPYTGSGSQKTWRTYTNSLSLLGAGGKVVLIPVYSDETTFQSAALAAYAKVFPGWTLVPIDSKVIIPGQGAIHCITMQIPAAAKSKMETDPADLCGATSIQCEAKVCGAITTQGCCDGELLKYCSQGTLKTSDCTTKPKCGWYSAKQYYECGTAGTPDPSGTFPMPCPGSVIPQDSGPPVQKDSAPPVQKDSAPPVQKDSAPPVQKDSAPPVQKDSAPPVQKDSASPFDASTSGDAAPPATDSGGGDQATTDGGAVGEAGNRATGGSGGCACTVGDRAETPPLLLLFGLVLLPLAWRRRDP
jgi:agmatine deiminase